MILQPLSGRRENIIEHAAIKTVGPASTGPAMLGVVHLAARSGSRSITVTC
jgi:hypothetical protein